MRTSSLPLGIAFRSVTFLGAIGVAGSLLAGCSSTSTTAADSASTSSDRVSNAATTVAEPSKWPSIPVSSPDVPTLHAEIVAQHNFPGAPFVQGLEFEEDGSLLVGTGQYGQSQIYRLPDWVNNPDGATPTAVQDLAPQLFGEGLTRIGNTVWQLTWREHTAIARDAETLVEKQTAELEREGWGLCNFGDSLVLSDGSGSLSIRNPETFAEEAQVPVTLGGQPTTWINELECVQDAEGAAPREVWANVWQTNTIFRIDPTTGAVTGTLDASNVVDALPAEVRESVDVLNGIAKIPGTDHYLLTGKKWPLAFEVRITG